MADSPESKCNNANCTCDPCLCDPCKCGVEPTSIPYKGRTLTITNEPDGTASVDVDGRVFTCTRHLGGLHGGAAIGHSSHGDQTPVGMPMWMCDEAYFGAFDLADLAKHFADYGYMFDDPNRVITDHEGNVVSKTQKKPASKKAATKKAR